MKPEIKTCLAQIRAGEIPQGYKNTPIGILKSDWSYAKLNEIVDILTETAGKKQYETLSISAGMGFVNQAKKFGKELSGKQYEKYIVLRKGDFSYNKGNSKAYPQGCIYRLNDRAEAAVPNVFESFRIANGYPEYYEQLFIAGFLNSQLYRFINHGIRDDGLLNLTEKDFYSCIVPVPPLEEQQRIASILSAQDKVIELCERKIEQLKRMKKYYLQNMFPKDGEEYPEIRFKGFTDSWKQRKIDELVEFYSGLTYKPEDVTENGTLVLRSSNVKNSEIVLTDNVYVDESVVNSTNVKKDDIIIVVRNGSKALIGKHAKIRHSMPNTVIGAFMTGLRSDSSDFINALLSTEIFDKEIKMNMGATINQITGYMFANMEFMTPSFQERQAVGSFFSRLDHLITLHQRKCEEEKKKKKALQQLLLTGLVRV